MAHATAAGPWKFDGGPVWNWTTSIEQFLNPVKPAVLKTVIELGSFGTTGLMPGLFLNPGQERVKPAVSLNPG